MDIKPHTLIKYRILQAYLGTCDIAFRKKDGTKGKYGDFAYIETHAGDGEGFIKKSGKLYDGSAILAAKISPIFPCILIENDPDCIRKLNEKAKNFPNIEVIDGDCELKINEALSKVSPECIKVVFVDPKNYKDVSWGTIEEIKKHRKTDIILNFPLNIIWREKEIPSAWDGITAFFGTDEWLKHTDSVSDLIVFYTKRLGYRYTYIHLIRSAKNDAPLYYLILGTNNPLGKVIGGWIWSKTIIKWVQKEFPKILYQVKSLEEFSK